MGEKHRRECDSNSSIEHLLIGPFDLVLETHIAEACDSDVSQTSLCWETESCEILHLLLLGSDTTLSRLVCLLSRACLPVC